MIRKIIGLGKYSAVIAIPREIMKKFGWRKGQKLVVLPKHKSLNVKDYKK